MVPGVGRSRFMENQEAGVHPSGGAEDGQSSCNSRSVLVWRLFRSALANQLGNRHLTTRPTRKQVRLHRIRSIVRG